MSLNLNQYFLYFFLILIIFFNFGCTKSNSSKYPSPFKNDKVQLNETYFAKVNNISAQHKTSSQNDINSVVVIINNQCAAENCGNDKNQEAITCELFKTKFDIRLKDSEQYYAHKPPVFETSEVAKAYFLNHKIDQSCLVGVSEIQNYETQDLDDTFYINQKTYLDMIQYEASRSHFTSTELEMVKVAVIDSGIGTSSDLPTVVANEDFRTNANPAGCSSAPAYSAATPQHFHGSFVAGIIAANSNNNLGIAGIANNVSLYSYNVGNCLGQISNVDVGNAILRAIGTHNVEIINMSLGGKMPDDVGLRNAMVQALNKDVFFVLAAGNDTVDVNSTPANSYYPAGYAADYPGVISVAALATSTTLASFSNFSAQYVSIAAPGVNIASTNGNASFRQASIPLSGGYGVDSGTSFSAPIVTGAMALTIGRLKKLSFDYDTAFLRRILLEAGTDQVPSLATKIKSGAVLNLLKLGQALSALESGGTSRSLTINTNIIGSGADVIVELLVDWDLIATHPGARLGLFDTGGTCNFSEPCLIQDFELTQLKGQQTIKLTRAELMTLVPDLRDPNFKLNITVAVYYKIPNYDPDTGAFINFKNNYGLDAQASTDLRTIDLSDTTSQLLGAITNIRKDMSNLYIKGWACYQGDNEAVSVRLLDNANNVIPTKSSYIYPYMVPHGTPIDTGKNWPNGDMSNDINSRVLTPSKANGIEVVFGAANGHKSGIEATPKIIDSCKTLTAAHGFELIVPLSQIKLLNQGLAKVEASFSSKTLIIKDSQNRSNFNLPEVFGLSNSINSFALNRGNQNFNSAGSLCSDSPAPVEIEVSYTHEDFLYAMFDTKNNVGGGSGPIGYVHIPAYANTTSIYYFTKSAANTAQITKTFPLSSASFEFMKYYNSMTAFKPNAYLDFDPDVNYLVSANTLDLRRLRTGEPITMFFQSLVVNDYGVLSTDQQNQSKLSQRTTGVAPIGLPSPVTSNSNSGLARYWDYYDVGEPFSLSFVGYSLNLSSNVGKWINDTFKIKSVLREVKKYETPQTTNAKILARGHLNRNGTCGSLFKHDFNVSILDYVQHAPKVDRTVAGLWIDPSNPTVLSRDDLANAMKRLPLTYRFYQEGKLIKHIVTDFGQVYTDVNYNF